MKLKKFNEFNSVRELNLEDLSMYLRENDKIKIKNRDGISTYTVVSIDELGIRVSNDESTVKTLIDFDFQFLNVDDYSSWEIISINGDDIYFNENASFVETPKLDILVSKFMEAGYQAKLAQNMVEVDEEHETADVYITDGGAEEPLNFTIYPDGSIVWNDFSHSTPFGNINNPDELTKEFIDAKFQEVDGLLNKKQANGRNR